MVRSEDLCAKWLSEESSRSWVGAEGLSVELFGAAQAISLNEDLDLARRMPGWFALGQGAGDALLCVELRSGRAALVEIDDLRAAAAQEIAASLDELFASGRWA